MLDLKGWKRPDSIFLGERTGTTEPGNFQTCPECKQTFDIDNPKFGGRCPNPECCGCRDSDLKYQTKIISGFPGIGKTTFHEKYPDTTLDSDSSSFGWIEKDGMKTRDPEFPENYIRHIKQNVGRYRFILVSSHKEVRDALKKHCLFFYLVYPDFGQKGEYIKRYKDRGSTDSFIKLLSENYESWFSDCENETIGCERVRMRYKNLEDEVKYRAVLQEDPE
jgi:hypothetical protein